MESQLGQVTTFCLDSKLLVLYWVQSLKLLFHIFRRDPSFLVKPSKGGDDDLRYNKEIAELKPKATRNIILIRHGQYNLEGRNDSERYLTKKGSYCEHIHSLHKFFYKVPHTDF